MRIQALGTNNHSHQGLNLLYEAFAEFCFALSSQMNTQEMYRLSAVWVETEVKMANEIARVSGDGSSA